MDVPMPPVDVPTPPVDVPPPPVDVPTPPAQISVRVAHLSPGAPAVDFCVRNAGAASFTGPVLRSLGVNAGLAYAQVTRALTLDPGAYTVRLVAPGSANCNTALAGLPDTTLPMLAAGARATVGAVGLLGSSGTTAFGLRPFVEEAPADASQLKVRFVHASPGTPAVDVGIPGAGTAFTGVFNNVSYPAAATPYFTSATALSAVTLAARVAGTPTAAGAYPLTLRNVSLPLGTTTTVYAIGRLDAPATPLSALVCNDTATTVGGNLTDCQVLGERPAATQINVRVAHLSPGAPAVDFCVRNAGAASFTGPVLRSLGVNAGLAYAQVTRALTLDPGAYTVRLVAPGSANCNTALAGLADVTLPALAGGARATVAAVGVLGTTGETAFRVQPYLEESASPSQLKVRFVHASPGTPNVDVGIPIGGTGFIPVFGNVAFPTAATPYFATATPFTNVTLAARVAGTPTNAGAYPLQLNNVNLGLGSLTTLYAVGRLGDRTTPLSALVCNDNGTTAGGNLTDCRLTPEPPAPQINVRVAHLSPDAPPVDFCVRNAGATSFTGPVLRSLAVNAGIAYTQVTRYLALDAGTYTVRLVAPGSTDCNTSLGGLADTTLPALAGGARATIGAVGLLAGTGATGFRLTAFAEDDTAAPTGQVRARFVHTSPGTPAVDVGIPGAGTAFTALFPNVAYPSASAYVNAPPLNAATLAARVAGTPTAAGTYPLQLDGVTAPAGTRLTVFAVGELDNDQTPLSALVCNDTTAPAGALSTCALLPERAFVRVAHLSPDAPAVDLCVRPASATTWAGATPVLRGAGAAGGLSFAQVTRYLGLAPAQYQVRLVAPGSTTCLTALGGLPDVTLPALAAGTRVTVAASGRLTGSGATAFTLRPLVDGNTRPALGRVHLRFAHLSPGAPNVDVGVLSGMTFSPVFSNVPYGSVANPAGSEPGTGYLPSAPLANATLQVRAAGTSTAVLTLPGVNVPATVSRGTSVTFFAIGLVGTTGNTRLSALACSDRAPATGLLAPCTRAP
jgi:hypothetical protein